jgi:hypothetical protein
MAKKSQLQKFKEAARSHKADQSERQFNRTLKRVAKNPPKKGRSERER